MYYPSILHRLSGNQKRKSVFRGEIGHFYNNVYQRTPDIAINEEKETIPHQYFSNFFAFCELPVNARVSYFADVLVYICD